MKKPRVDMRLVTPKEQAKPSILKAETNERRGTAFRPYRKTVTYSLREDVLELLHRVRYETGQNYNQIIEDALRLAYSK